MTIDSKTGENVVVGCAFIVFVIAAPLWFAFIVLMMLLSLNVQPQMALLGVVMFWLGMTLFMYWRFVPAARRFRLSLQPNDDQ